MHIYNSCRGHSQYIVIKRNKWVQWRDPVPRCDKSYHLWCTEGRFGLLLIIVCVKNKTRYNQSCMQYNIYRDIFTFFCSKWPLHRKVSHSKFWEGNLSFSVSNFTMCIFGNFKGIKTQWKFNPCKNVPIYGAMVQLAAKLFYF